MTTPVPPDAVDFDGARIAVEPIRAEDEYAGTRATLPARSGKARLTLQIDMGLGDAVWPAPEKCAYPTLLDFPAPKTRDLAGLLKKMGTSEKRCLLVLGEHRANAYLSGRNIANLQTIPVRELNPYLVMQSEAIVFEMDGLEKIREVVRI